MKKIFDFIPAEYRVYFWTGFWVIIGLTVGLIFVFLTPSIVFPIALIWSLGFCIVGGLTGFVFAVPKVISNSGGASVRTAGLTANEKEVLQANNNLTEISDWLTKIIIGASLVQLREIPPYIIKVGKRMAIGIADSPPYYEKISVFCSGIVVYFVTFGFVAGFLIMRLVISDLLIDSDSGSKR